MILTLQQIIDGVWRATGTDINSLPQADVVQYINLAYDELTKKVNFREADRTVTISLANGTQRYALGSLIPSGFDALRHVAIQDSYSNSTGWMPLEQVDFNEILDSQEDALYSTGIPERYAREGVNIAFDPIPNSAYSVKLRYRRSFGDVLSSGPEIPSEWHEIIRYGAIARAWFDLGNIPRSNYADQKVAALVSTSIDTETKEDRDYSYAAGSLPRRRYP